MFQRRISLTGLTDGTLGRRAIGTIGLRFWFTTHAVGRPSDHERTP